MRIAFFVGEFPALTQTFILNQITGLLDRQHEVDIFATCPPKSPLMHTEVTRYGLLVRTYYQNVPRSLTMRVLKGAGLALASLFQNPGLTTRSLNVVRYGPLAASLALLYGTRPLLPKRTYDIVHCHFGPYGLLAVGLRDLGLLEGRIITTFHGYDVTSLPRRYGRSIYAFLFEHGELYTVNSSFTAQQAKRLGCPPDRIIRLPMGADLSRLPFKERHAAPTDCVHILTVGRLVEVKGIEYGIRALARIVAEFPNIRYQIVGDGPLRRRLEQLTDQLGLRTHVEFLGRRTRDQVVALYATAHLSLLPSIVARDGAEEGQGLVLVEAQASGLPVIASRVGGIPETVNEGGSALLVPPCDADALAEGLRVLLRRRELWGPMGRAGRLHVETHYDIEKLNDELVRIYQRMLRAHAGIPA
ncbi:MAG: glycosyltransferase [Planctomycetota bacterium]